MLLLELMVIMLYSIVVVDKNNARNVSVGMVAEENAQPCNFNMVYLTATGLLHRNISGKRE